MNMNKKFLTKQAVILAAGKSFRFWPLNQAHKSLFKIMGRPLICHTLDNLKKAGVKEVVIVQNAKRDIEKELKKYRPPLKITFISQRKPSGTGDALLVAKKRLKDKFLVLNGDDYYDIKSIKGCLGKFPSVLVKKTNNWRDYGVWTMEKDHLKDIIERPKKYIGNLINCGGYFLPKSILDERIEKSPRGEYEILDYLKKLVKKQKLYFFKTDNWLPLSYCWNLFDINEHLLKNIKTKIAGKIEKNCQIKGRVIIEKGALIKSGTYLEGPTYVGKNSQIGPNCYLRDFTSVGENCRIGQGVEIKNSIIGNNSRISHLSYLGDSIVGENCNLGAGVVFANLRFDNKIIKSRVKGRTIETGRTKFGAVLGKNSKVGINVSLMPGVLVGRECVIGPKSVVAANIEDGTIFYTKFQKIIKKKKVG